MAYSLLQETIQTGGGSTTTVKAYGSNVAANTLLICEVSSSGPSSPASGVTDTKLNSWSQAGAASVSALGDTVQIFYAVSNGAGANTVTVTFPDVNQGDTMTISEYSGNATSSPLDQTDVGQGVSATPASTSITPSVANCLIISVESDSAVNGTTITAGTNFGIRQTQLTSSTLERIGTEDWIQTTATATTGSFTLGISSTWATKVASFKPLAAAVTGTNARKALLGVGI
jgi:hypothetical protein